MSQSPSDALAAPSLHRDDAGDTLPDRLFATLGAYPSPFAFTPAVARVFDDMAQRSIPLYGDVLRATAALAVRCYQEGRCIYDLGCSTGTALASIAAALAATGRRAQLVGVDLSEAMLARAQGKLARYATQHDVTLLAADIAAPDWGDRMQPASVVVANYTLQFIPVRSRPALLARIHAALVPGGAFMLSEKIRAGTHELEELTTTLYESYKASQGYTLAEIARKRAALAGVLVPLTLSEQLRMLETAGFRVVEPLLKWNNFVSIVAVKC